MKIQIINFRLTPHGAPVLGMCDIQLADFDIVICGTKIVSSRNGGSFVALPTFPSKDDGGKTVWMPAVQLPETLTKEIYSIVKAAYEDLSSNSDALASDDEIPF